MIKLNYTSILQYAENSGQGLFSKTFNRKLLFIIKYFINKNYQFLL